MKRTTLEFSGIKPVSISSFRPIRGSSEQQRNKWLPHAHGRQA